MSDTFFLIDGDTGSGKSSWTASRISAVCVRNRKWHTAAMNHWKETGKVLRRIKTTSGKLEWIYEDSDNAPLPREVWSCMKLSDEFTNAFGGVGASHQFDGKMIHYWDSEEFHRVVPYLRDCDIFVDEIGAIVPADGWKDCPLETRRFFAQHRKRGIEIYANTQDYHMVDVNARTMMSHVYHAMKLIGSPDISATKPPPKYIWGVIAIMEIANFKETDRSAPRTYDGFPDFLFLDRDLIDIYDTTEDIKGAGYAPFRHVLRKCEKHGLEDGCDYEKVAHI